MKTLKAHFASIAEMESAKVADGALHLIARASDGSVRDGLSLLDQAVSHADQDGGEISEDQVRAMLGLADRSRTFMLLEAVMAGEVAQALDLLDQLYREGADPLAILEDLLEITHWLTRIKVSPAAADAPEVPEIERVRGRDMESRLTMAALARCWQMLLKGLSEVRLAPSPIQAAEMILVRLAHTADLPTPEEAIRKMESSAGSEPPSAGAAPQTAAVSSAPAPSAGLAPSSPPPEARMTGTHDAAVAPPEPQPQPEPLPEPSPEPVNDTGPAAATQATENKKKDAANHPLVRAVLETFPGATIEEVRDAADVPDGEKTKE